VWEQPLKLHSLLNSRPTDTLTVCKFSKVEWQQSVLQGVGCALIHQCSVQLALCTYMLQLKHAGVQGNRFLSC